MKGYICAFLLLMCGMAHSGPGTKVQGGCLFGSKVLSVGRHTTTPCMELICDTDGQITFGTCPSMVCNPGEKVNGYKPERPGIPYPDCCAQPICKGRHYRAYPDYPSLYQHYALPQVGIEFE